MKKTVSILLLVILTTSLITACAGASESAMTSEVMWAADNNTLGLVAPQAAPMPETEVWDDMDSGVIRTGGGTMQTAGSDAVPISETVTESFAEKIIYSIYADIETLNFDESIDNVYIMLRTYGAFIEFSSVSGVNYESRFYGWNQYRHASFTLRVPVENLEAMRGSLEYYIGNVVHLNSSAENITSRFFDTQSRLNSLVIQEERLLSMLSQSNDITELIALEERLGDIRYQIESLTTTLNNWQQQVDFSTMTLSIREVEEYTEQIQIHRTYWEQIGDGFMASLRGVGRFFMGLFRWLIVSAPVLVVFAVVVVVILLIVRKTIRSNAEKMKKIREKSSGYPNAHGYTYPTGYQNTHGYPGAPAQPITPAQPTDPTQPTIEQDRPE